MSLLILALLLISSSTATADRITATWEHTGESIYDNGFMYRCMKSADGGVSLFNMDILENDSPGAGRSEKGVTSDIIWGDIRARKILTLDDPRAFKAHLVFWVYRKGDFPLGFTVNGHESSCENWKDSGVVETYRWVEFPVEWLKRGRNIIELYSPEASTPEEGWELYIARADEFENGGGNPADVGKTSFKSTDGGESWKESPFGPLGQTRAEYTVRLSLDRHILSGWVSTPVIDLWKGDSEEFISRQHIIRRMILRGTSHVPEETQVEYLIRKGSDPSPYADSWGPYEPIGSGERLELDIGDNSEVNWESISSYSLNRRYIQIKAILTTTNPLVTPVFKSLDVSTELEEPFPVPRHENIIVLDTDNPPIKYSSIDWKWESAQRQEFIELRKRENTDRLVDQSLSQFDAQVKLLDYATKRWRWVSPLPEYPGWDALSIADRIDNMGGGGMCIQFNLFLGGLCQAYGWQARLVNIVGHEVCEVWNDDFGKWIYLDASYVNHYVADPETGEPLNMLELHDRYVEHYFPGGKIDWMKDFTGTQKYDKSNQPVVRGSLESPPKVSHNGFTHAAFMRMMPRNNYYEKPYPRPLSHGSSWWPWDGYINWYDSQSPPKRQYSQHTDRPRDMWPDLNRVHIDATQGFGNDRLFLRFETYTPNFSHFEINHNDRGWEKVETDHWTWFLASGRNSLRVRAVNELGAKGKASCVTLNHIDAPLGEYMKESGWK